MNIVLIFKKEVGGMVRAILMDEILDVYKCSYGAEFTLERAIIADEMGLDVICPACGLRLENLCGSKNMSFEEEEVSND